AGGRRPVVHRRNEHAAAAVPADLPQLPLRGPVPLPRLHRRRQWRVYRRGLGGTQTAAAAPSPGAAAGVRPGGRRRVLGGRRGRGRGRRGGSGRRRAGHRRRNSLRGPAGAGGDDNCSCGCARSVVASIRRVDRRGRGETSADNAAAAATAADTA
ncbi:unnamed protein product, partial [Ectocarpus fasciculatus]